MKDYDTRLRLALDVKPGDVCVNIKTGKKATVVHVNRNLGILHLDHESGRQTSKYIHYFTFEFEPLKG